MTLGENVKYLREAKGLTYEAVGKAVGTDAQNIFNLEKRKSKVSKFAPALASFFEVDLDALMSSDISSVFQIHGTIEEPGRKLSVVTANYDKFTESSIGEFRSDEVIELLALFQMANRRERESILDLARAIANRDAMLWKRAGND